MVNNKEILNRQFHALADGTRRAILERLSQGDALVSDLAAPFSMSLPAISKHLRVLEEAGFISKRKEGRIRHCHLESESFKTVSEWLDFYQAFWDIRLDRLTEQLESAHENTKTKDK